VRAAFFPKFDLELVESVPVVLGAMVVVVEVIVMGLVAHKFLTIHDQNRVWKNVLFHKI